jgi:hemoglobin-like flavoprotein
MSKRLQMSEAKLRLLQESVLLLDEQLPEMVRYAYDRFAAHPDTRDDFLADREKRERVLVEFLRSGVLGAVRSGDLAPLVPRFERLAIIHASVGMSDDLLRAAGGIFVDGMAAACGSRWSARFSGAWHELFEQTGQLMVQTARSARAVGQVQAPQFQDEAARPVGRGRP